MGTYEETNAETGEVSECTVAANNGRYGPYLTKTGADGKSETRSLASEDEIFTVDIDKAKELFSQPKYGRGRGRGAAKPPLRDLGKDPNTGKNVTIKDGRFARTSPMARPTARCRVSTRLNPSPLMTPSDCSPKSVRLVPPPVAVAVLGVLVAPSRCRQGQEGRYLGCGFGAGGQARRTPCRSQEVGEQGWSNQRIAEKLGSTPATVKKDVDWLTANEGYERPAVIPKRG